MIESYEKRLYEIETPPWIRPKEWHHDAWYRLCKFTYPTESRREAEEFFESLGPGVVGFVGEKNSGKTYQLLRHFNDAKGIRDDTRTGIVVNVDNLRTTKFFAYGICTALTGGSVDYSGQLEQTLTETAIELAAAIGEPIIIDNFQDLISAGKLVDETLDDFLFDLASVCPLVLCGRPVEFHETLGFFPKLLCSIKVIHIVKNPQAHEISHLLHEVCRHVSWPGKTCLSSPQAIRLISTSLAEKPFADYERLLKGVFAISIEQNERDITIKHLEKALEDARTAKPITIGGSQFGVSLNEVLLTTSDPGDVEPYSPSVLPRDGIWKIPLKAAFDIPVIDERKLRPAYMYRQFYAQMDFGHEAVIDVDTGSFYRCFEEADPHAAIAEHIFEEAETLFMSGGCTHEPFIGFPFGAKTHSEARKGLTESVLRLLPRIADSIRVSSRGRFCIRQDQPYYVLNAVNDRLSCAISFDTKSLSEKARAFDFDDLDGIFDFAKWIEHERNYSISGLFKEYSDTIVERVPHAIPRNAHTNFMNALGYHLIKVIGRASKPEAVSSAVTHLCSVSSHPQPMETVATVNALHDLYNFFRDSELRLGPGEFGLNILDIAIFRTYAAAGHTPKG
jgi:hypothetical protein